MNELKKFVESLAFIRIESGQASKPKAQDKEADFLI